MTPLHSPPCHHSLNTELLSIQVSSKWQATPTPFSKFFNIRIELKRPSAGSCRFIKNVPLFMHLLHLKYPTFCTVIVLVIFLTAWNIIWRVEINVLGLRLFSWQHKIKVAKIYILIKFSWPSKFRRKLVLFISVSTFPSYIVHCRGPGSSVGIATVYGLDGPGSNAGGDEIFRPSRPALGPTQSPVNGYWVFPGGKVRPGRAADHSFLLVPRS